MALRPPPPIKKAVTPVKATSSPDSDGLPQSETDQIVNLTSLRWLFISPPGFGKTELFSLFPNAIMAQCEEGHKFVKGFKVIVDDWEGREETEDSDGNMHLSFMEFCRRMTRSDRFSFISIDTLDALVKKCIDEHVGKANAGHLSDLGEYGKGFDLGQNDPIRQALNQLFRTGRGIGLTTHQQVSNANFKKGVVSKKETTLPAGIFKIVYPQMDVIIHGEFGGIREGNTHRDRILRSVGSEDLLAKNRGGVLPPAWISPLDTEQRIAQIQSFFEGDADERKAAVEAAYAEYLEFYNEP